MFVPVFLLSGTAKYLFAPLSLSVIVALLVSLGLSFTLVPVLFKYVMRSHVKPESHLHAAHSSRNPFTIISFLFEHGFVAFRRTYQNYLAWSAGRPRTVALLFVLLLGGSCFLVPSLGMDFFPQVDAGQMRLHVRTPSGTKLEDAQSSFASVEREIRRIVGDDQIDVMIDNIGLPYSGINIALSDTATVGPMDGEILISLKEKHTPIAGHIAALRRELPDIFPEMGFFFQPADIVNQVLNFGQAAPIDIRVSGPHREEDYAAAAKIERDLRAVPGLADVHIFQVASAPAMRINVDRTLAQQMGMTQRDVASSVLVALNSSSMVSPNFWLNPRSDIIYPLVVQAPQYRVDSMPSLMMIPVVDKTGKDASMLMGVAKVARGALPVVLSQLNIRPVYDVQADVQGRDLASASAAIDRVIKADMPDAASGVHVDHSGQVQTMRDSFVGLAGGMILAVALVCLLMVISFQSWIDPIIVLLAVPVALAGVVWMLFLTGTHVSVPRSWAPSCASGWAPPTVCWSSASPSSACARATRRASPPSPPA